MSPGDRRTGIMESGSEGVSRLSLQHEQVCLKPPRITEHIIGEAASTTGRMRNAILYIQLSREFSTSLDYDAGTATMSASCDVGGIVWNTDSKFDGARVRVSFLKGIDVRMDQYARDHGLPGACGNVEIAPELVPETFQDDDGETITLPQITIWVGIDGESFRSIEAGLTSCVASDRQAMMSVRFSHRAFTGIMPLERLDLSGKTEYPVVAFNVSYLTPPALKEC
jgi:hypothetical protein